MARKKSLTTKIFSLLKGQVRTGWILLTMFVILGIVDLLSISLLAPFVRSLANYGSSDAIDLSFSSIGNLEIDTSFLGYLIILVFTLRTLIALWANQSVLKFGEVLVNRLQVGLTKKFQLLSFKDFNERKSNEYIYDIQTLTIKFNELIEAILLASSGVIVSLFVVSYLIVFYTTEFLLLSFFLGISMGTYKALAFSKLKNYGSSHNTANNRLIAMVTEAMKGFREIKIYNQESRVRKEVESATKSITHNYRLYQIIYKAPPYIFESLIVIFVVGISLVFVETRGGTEVMSMISVFGLAALRLRPAIAQFVQVLGQLQFATDLVGRLYESWENVEPELTRDTPGNLKNTEKKIANISLQNCLVMADNKNLLEGVSLDLSVGKWYGVLGESGSGKTTLMNAVVRYSDVVGGAVTYSLNNGENTEDLESCFFDIAYVPQESFVFDTSLKDNVVISSKNFNGKVYEQAIDFTKLRNLDSELRTQLGETGNKISGGQRQRISIARAIYSQRTVLMLDEATSALDNQVESHVMNSLVSLKKDKIILQVTHNKGLLKFFDEIIVLKEGKIIYKGAPEKYF